MKATIIPSNEFDSTIDAINQLSEEDAKAFLKIIYGHFNNYETGTGASYTSEQLIKEVASIYSEKILKVNELRKANQDESTVSG